MTHLLHSTATVPSRVYQTYDARHNHTWSVSKSGDGFIQVLEPRAPGASGNVSGDEASPPGTVLPRTDPELGRDTIEKLINSYFADVASLIPIVTEAEFVADPSPPPILLYSICLVAAAKREVPQRIFDSLRATVNTLIKNEEVLSTASIVNVQSLLVLCMCGDCHSGFVPNGVSALWIRLGAAIRMVCHRTRAHTMDTDRDVTALS